MPGTTYDITARAALDFSGFSKSLLGMLTGADDAGKKIDKLLNAALIATGTAIVGAITASIQFESSFAGVTKTTEGLRDEFGKLNAEGIAMAQGFRDMAKEIPISVNELNRIGELGGQLGIGKTELLSFTDTIAKMGVTTNLTTEAAATEMAQFINVTKNVAPAGLNAAEQMERLGSTIVDLGNNYATTEASISSMAQRLAGAGSVIGLSQADILGFSTALTSVGISAEAGGTAFSTVMIQMANAVASGGSQLEEFARVAGETVPAFSTEFRENAAGALTKFVTGLNRVKGEGENVFATLEGMDLQSIRVRNTLLLASGAGDLMSEAMKRSSKAYEENTALAKEAEQRFGTLESQLIILKNVVYDLAIEYGDKLTPYIKDFTEYLNKNPEIIENVIKAFVGFAAVGATILGVKKAWQAYNTTMDLVKKAQALLATGLSSTTLALGGIGLALAAAAALYYAYKSAVEASEKAEREAITTISEQTAELSDLYSKYENLKSAGELTAKQQLEFEKVTKELNDRLAAEGKTLDDVTGNFQGFITAQDEASKSDLKNQIEETKKKIEDADAKVQKYTSDLSYNSEVAGHYKDIAEEQRKKLELLTAEYAEVTDKVNYQKTAQELLNTATITGKDAIEAHLVSLKSSIQLNEGNKTLTEQLSAEVTKYEGELEKLTTQTNDYSSAVNATIVPQKTLAELLKEMGITSIGEVNEEIGKLNGLMETLKNANYDTSYEMGQVRDKLVKLYEDIGDNEAIIKLYTGMDSASLSFKDFNTVVGDMRGQIQLANPEMITMEDIQKKLADAGISVKANLEEQASKYEALIPHVKGNKEQSKELLDKLKPLYEQMGKEDEFNKLIDNLGMSKEYTKLQKEEVIKAKEKMQEYSNQVVKLATDFYNLGPLASGGLKLLTDTLVDMTTTGFDPAKLGAEATKLAFKELGPVAGSGVDLLTTSLTGLLTGGLDPVSLGIKAVTFVAGLFGGKNEEIVRTLEQVHTSLGTTWTDVENLRKVYEKTGIESGLVEELNAKIDSYVEKLKTATGDTRVYLEQLVADAQKNMNQLLLIFSTDVEFKDLNQGLADITERIKGIATYYGTSAESMGGASTLLYQKIIDSQIFMKNSLEEGSFAWLDMNKNLQDALELYYSMTDEIGILADLMGAGIWALSSGDISVLETRLRALLSSQYDLDAEIIDGFGNVTTLRKEFLKYGLTAEQIDAIMKEFADTTKDATVNNEELGKSMEDLGEKTTVTYQKFKDMAELMAALPNSIMQTTSEFDKLFGAFEKNQDYFGGIADPKLQDELTAWMMQAVQDLIALGIAGGKGSKAYDELQDKIWKTQAALAVMRGEFASIEDYLLANGIELHENAITVEDLTGEYDKLNKELEDLKAKRIKLDEQFEFDRAKIDEKISGMTAHIQDLIEQRNSLRLQFKVDEKNLQDKITRLNNLIATMGQEGAPGLNEINSLINELTGNTDRLTINWGDMMSQMMGEYEGFTTDIKTAQNALEQIAGFQMDLDTTQADEQINNLIWRMWEYLDTLDPNSPKYKEMKAQLDKLVLGFVEAGGVLDEEAAKAFAQEKAEAGVKTLEDQLADLMANYKDSELKIGLEIKDSMEKLSTFKKELADLIADYNDQKIKIDLDIGVLSTTIQDLLNQIAAMGGGGGSQHYGGIVRAHTGMLANDEIPAILKRREVVIPESIAGRMSEVDWRNIIATGNMQDRGGDIPINNNVQINVEAIVHQEKGETWIEFKEKVDRWDRENTKNKTEVTIFQ